jgi:hypothetical protein
VHGPTSLGPEVSGKGLHWVDRVCLHHLTVTNAGAISKDIDAGHFVSWLAVGSLESNVTDLG